MPCNQLLCNTKRNAGSGTFTDQPDFIRIDAKLSCFVDDLLENCIRIKNGERKFDLWALPVIAVNHYAVCNHGQFVANLLSMLSSTVDATPTTEVN